jgi:hypothetical protein
MPFLSFFFLLVCSAISIAPNACQAKNVTGSSFLNGETYSYTESFCKTINLFSVKNVYFSVKSGNLSANQTIWPTFIRLANEENTDIFEVRYYDADYDGLLAYSDKHYLQGSFTKGNELSRSVSYMLFGNQSFIGGIYNPDDSEDGSNIKKNIIGSFAEFEDGYSISDHFSNYSDDTIKQFTLFLDQGYAPLRESFFKQDLVNLIVSEVIVSIFLSGISLLSFRYMHDLESLMTENFEKMALYLCILDVCSAVISSLLCFLFPTFSLLITRLASGIVCLLVFYIIAARQFRKTNSKELAKND